jgi:hypothetical protein
MLLLLPFGPAQLISFTRKESKSLTPNLDLLDAFTRKDVKGQMAEKATWGYLAFPLTCDQGFLICVCSKQNWASSCDGGAPT